MYNENSKTECPWDQLSCLEYTGVRLKQVKFNKKKFLHWDFIKTHFIQESGLFGFSLDNFLLYKIIFKQNCYFYPVSTAIKSTLYNTF